MPKKYDYLIISIPFILAILFLAGLAWYEAKAAPIANVFRSLLPETENQYYLGTTTPSRISWKDIIGRNLTITSGSATTTIGTGVSTLAGGFVSQASSTVAGNFTVTGTCTGCGGVSGGGGLNQLTYWTSASALAATQTPTGTAFFATSTLIASRFPIASSTSFSIEDRLWVSGAGTSTFQGALDATGDARFGTIRVLGASKFPSGAIDIAALSASSLSVTAGSGLSGGGAITLGGSATIDVGAGTCITSAADSVSVTSNCTDAATVDSIEGASLLRSDASDNYTAGTLTFDAGTTGIVNGSWGFGTGTPGTVLSVTGAGVLTGHLMATNFIATSTTATSTFAGDFSARNTRFTDSISIAGSFHSSADLTVTSVATSTFSGGGSFAGLSTSQGITSSAGDFRLTGGKIISTGAGTSTFSGGLTADVLNPTAFMGAGLSACNQTTGKILWAGGAFFCGVDATGAGISGGGGLNMLAYWDSKTTISATNTPTMNSFFATSTTIASRFPIASTTSFSIEDRLWVAGAGTSTIAGGLSIAGTTGNIGISSSTPTELLALGGSAIIGGQVKQPWFKLTDGATITVNCEDGKWQYVTLGGNRTLAFADCDPGESVIVKVKIGTAGQTLTLPDGMIGVVKGMGTTTQNASTWFGFTFFNGNPYLIASTSTPPE